MSTEIIHDIDHKTVKMLIRDHLRYQGNPFITLDNITIIPTTDQFGDPGYRVVINE